MSPSWLRISQPLESRLLPWQHRYEILQKGYRRGDTGSDGLDPREPDAARVPSKIWSCSRLTFAVRSGTVNVSSVRAPFPAARRYSCTMNERGTRWLTPFFSFGVRPGTRCFRRASSCSSLSRRRSPIPARTPRNARNESADYDGDENNGGKHGAALR